MKLRKAVRRPIRFVTMMWVGVVVMSITISYQQDGDFHRALIDFIFATVAMAILWLILSVTEYFTK